MNEPMPVARLDRPHVPASDCLFAEPRPQDDFRFTQEVAGVFDDMVSRSVPFYAEMQRMAAEIVCEFAQGGTVYDLGCSTGTTLALLDAALPEEVRLVGIDNSQPMLDQARAKLDGLGSARRIDLVKADLHNLPRLDDAVAVIMTLTLQFVRPLRREQIVRHIHEGLRKRACLLLFEKLIVSDSLLNRLFIKFYYEMKRRNGYSEIEIAQKRQALENVLIPYRPEENVALLRSAGFSAVDEVFRWYNFCGVLAVK
jgi:tRNA (cmo5U34)-methyltransferase